MAENFYMSTIPFCQRPFVFIIMLPAGFSIGRRCFSGVQKRQRAMPALNNT